MATLIPKINQDVQNAAYLSMGNQPGKPFKAVAHKYMKFAKNPAKSVWKSFTGIFGFGVIVHKRGKGSGSKKGKPTHRKRK